MEAAGGRLAIMGNTADQLFYMAAAESRQSDSRALDIPSILIGSTGRNWLATNLASGVLLEIGIGGISEPRCSGGVHLVGSSGSFTSGPAGKTYCSWQDCAWHIALDTDDIVVVYFTRMTMECMTAADGQPYDYVAAYDGITDAAPQLARFYCNTHYPIASEGPHMLLTFHTDDLYNYYGFAATYASGATYCAAFTSCGACAAESVHCGWCRTSHACVPLTGPRATCASEAWTLGNSSTCCPAGWSGLACDVCAPGHFGATCQPCACAPGGTCADGLGGDGTCSCSTGWAGALCDSCASGHWGDDCAACGCVGGSSCSEGDCRCRASDHLPDLPSDLRSDHHHLVAI